MSVLGRQDYQWQHEPCLYGWVDGKAHYFTFDRTQTTIFDDEPNINRMSKDELKAYIRELWCKEPTTVMREAKPAKSAEHPTMKPVPLLGRLISNSSRRGEIVLDPFAGSGSTLIAAEQLGRRCYCMEIDPQYADVIITRWEELIGGEAEMEDGHGY
jgi:DNA modification methylase